MDGKLMDYEWIDENAMLSLNLNQEFTYNCEKILT